MKLGDLLRKAEQDLAPRKNQSDDQDRVFFRRVSRYSDEFSGSRKVVLIPLRAYKKPAPEGIDTVEEFPVQILYHKPLRQTCLRSIPGETDCPMCEVDRPSARHIYPALLLSVGKDSAHIEELILFLDYSGSILLRQIREALLSSDVDVSREMDGSIGVLVSPSSEQEDSVAIIEDWHQKIPEGQKWLGRFQKLDDPEGSDWVPFLYGVYGPLGGHRVLGLESKFQALMQEIDEQIHSLIEGFSEELPYSGEDVENLPF